ncbi:MAG: hypothetical protein AAGH15_03380 [Myxococcota bacterium]
MAGAPGPPPSLDALFVRDGMVVARHARGAASLDEMEAVLVAFDALLERTGAGLLLLDVRRVVETVPAVQERLWEWMAGHPRLLRVAALMESREDGRNMRTDGAERGVRLRVFPEEPAARTWLLGLGELSGVGSS